MKQTSILRILGLLLIMTLVFSGCTAIDKPTQSDNAESPAITEAPAQAPAPTAAPAAEPAPSSAPAEAPAPTDTPASPAPYASASVPTITKSPTGETVEAGGSAMFLAKSEGATRTEWHFVNSDFSQDLDYAEAAQVFDRLEIIDGDTGSLVLRNIPESLNGWSVYCHFSNAVGSADTDRAAITVKASPSSTQTAFDYTGNFTEAGAQRGVMEITGSPDLYSVSVSWHEGSTEKIWTFSGTFSETGVLSYSNGVLTTIFPDEGTHELTYTSGTGTLSYVDSGVVGVYWSDDQAGLGANIFFAKD